MSVCAKGKLGVWHVIEIVGNGDGVAQALDWIEASGNYVTVHAGGTRHLIRTSLTRVASRLDPRRFLRIPRSTVVHLDRVQSLVPASHGDYTVVLRDGTTLNMSRTYREHLQRVLELGF